MENLLILNKGGYHYTEEAYLDSELLRIQSALEAIIAMQEAEEEYMKKQKSDAKDRAGER